MVACPHLAVVVLSNGVIDSIWQLLISACKCKVVNLSKEVNLFAFKICSVYGLVMCCGFEG